MKRINMFSEWKSTEKLNEDISILSLQIGVILGVLGWKGLKALIKKVAKSIGYKAELSKEKLNDIINEIIDEIAKKNESEINLNKVKSSMKDKVESGEIKTLSDVEKYFKEFL